MLGEKIGEAKGRITTQRVVAVANGGPKLEVSFEETGQLLGLSVHEIGTYASEPTGPGTVYGEGQGITVGPDGEAASWRGGGVGRLGKNGAVSYRGCIYYSAPPSSKLARLNGVALAFEYEVDGTGETVSRVWEWK